MKSLSSCFPWCDERGFDRIDNLHSGSVFIYMNNNGAWEPFPGPDGKLPDGRDFKLYPSFLTEGDLFGHSVDISKDEDGSHTLIVGSPGKSHPLTGEANTGSVYVFNLAPIHSAGMKRPKPATTANVPNVNLGLRIRPPMAR